MRCPRSILLLSLFCISAGVLPAESIFADTDTSFGNRTGEGSTPFTGLAQAPEANLFTGALATSIPIVVPPGHKNATPSIALQYSSSGGPGPFGLGWDLPIGRIERTTKWGVPLCTSSHFNEFVLTLPGSVAELVNDPPGSAIHRPRVEESYVKAELNAAANSWTVYDRAGMKYEFGTVSSARIGTDPAVFLALQGESCTYTTAWALTRVTDPNGNTIVYSWANLFNQLVPVGIQYGGNIHTGAPHRYGVILNYEGRPDVQDGFRHGEPAKLWLRLSLLQTTMAIPGPSNSVISAYRFYYDDSQPGQKSLLRSVETSGRPTQTFVYAPSTAGHAPAVSFSAPYPFLRSHNESLEVKNTVLDMNGDGLLDYVHWTDSSPWQVRFGSNAGGTFGFSASVTTWTPPPVNLLGFGAQIRNVEVNPDACPAASGTQAACTIADTFDITGDGVADYVVATDATWKVYPGRYSSALGWYFDTVLPKDGGTAIPEWSAPSPRVRYTSGAGLLIRDVIDMNGDGLPDLVLANQNPWLVYLNTGSGFEAVPVPFAVPAEWGNPGIPEEFADFNGDGLPDYIRWRQGHTAETGGGGSLPECLLATTSGYIPYTTGGYITYYHDCMYVYFNTGSGFRISPKQIDTSFLGGRGGSYSGTGYEEVDSDLLDVNGDGLPDQVYRYAWNEVTHTLDDQWSVRLNIGGDLEPLAISSYGPLVWDYSGEHGQTWGYPARRWAGGQGSIRTTKNRRGLVDMIDLDGDGILDRVVAGTTGTEAAVPTSWNVQRNRAGTYSATGTDPSQRPNLMTMMSNGFGGTNAIVYRPSTAYDNTGTDPQDTTGANDQPDLPFVTWVVEKSRMSDGGCPAPGGDVFNPATNPCIAAGHERVTKFRYLDGRFDSVNREFRGFRQVERITEEAHQEAAGTAVDDPDNATVSVYSQADGTVGRLLSRSVHVGAACDAANPEPDCSTPTMVYRDQNQWSLGTVGTGRTQVWLGQSESATIDATGAPVYVRIGNAAPDAYGNIPESTKYNLFSQPLVTTHTDYALPASGSGPQVFNRPKRTITSDPSGVLQEQWFYYDGFTSDGDLGSVSAGNVRRVKSRLDGNTPHGPETWTAYDDYGNITSVTDANGHETVTEYDSYDLHPVRVTTQVGALTLETLTTIDYRWGLPTSVTDSNMVAVSQTSYDELGRPQCRARAGETLADCPIAYEYHFAETGAGASDPTTWVKITEKQEPRPPMGCGGTATPRPPLWTKSVVDALGRVRYTDTFRMVDAAVATVRANHTDHDAAGRVTFVRNPYLDTVSPSAGDGERRSYAMTDGRIDPLGRVHRITHSDGTSRATEYAGTLTTTTDEELNVTQSIVDPLGRVVERRVNNASGTYAATYSTYDGAGRLKAVGQRDGTAKTIKTMTYDSLGRKIQMVDVDSGTWRYGYDGVGNLAWEDDPTPGQHLQYCYDEINRPLRRCAWPDDSPPSHSCAQACPSTPERAQYFYDGDDGWAVAYAKGRLTRVIDGETVGGTTTDGAQSDVVAYDARGRATSTRKSIVVDQEERHATFQFAYDTTDRVTSTTYPDGEQVFTEYDDSGQPQAVRSTTQFYVIDATYDRFGRARRVQHGNNVVDTLTYGGASDRHRLAALKTVLPNTPAYLDLTYQLYDGRGLLTQLRDQRDPLGARSNTADYAYDLMGRLTNVDSVSPDVDRTYDYDALGNIKRNGNLFFEYHATKLHQIAKVHLDSPTGPYTSVVHDSDGNRTDKFTQHYDYTRHDRVKAITSGGQYTAFRYDYAGMRVARLVGDVMPTITRYYSSLAETTDTTLTKWYFLGDRRIAMRQNSNVAWETAGLGDTLFRFAGVSGVRPALVLLVAQQAGQWLGLGLGVFLLGLWVMPGRGHRAAAGFVLRRGRVVVVVVLWVTGTLPWPTVIQPEPAEGQTDVIRHYHLDHLGSTQAITSNSGALLEQIRYDGYGKVRGRWDGSNTVLTPGAAGRYEFTGYETQSDSGIEYAGARFYDPEFGSFLSHDPMAEFPNPYTYVHWDPVNSTDPGGACEVSCIVGLVFLFGGVVSSAVQSAINGAGPKQAIENSLVGALAGLTFQSAVIGPIGTAFAGADAYVDALQTAYGVYSVKEGFENGQGVQAGFGAVVLAYGFFGIDRILGGGDTRLAAIEGNTANDASQVEPGRIGVEEDWVAFIASVLPISRVVFQGLSSVGVWTSKPSTTVPGSQEPAPSWIYGSHKSMQKWINQMQKRGWTPEQITEAIEGKLSFPSPNLVNPANTATRYVHPATGRYVVVDDVTNELLQVGGRGFAPLEP